MKIIAKQKAFYNNEIIKPGRIINDFKEDKAPNWGEVCSFDEQNSSIQQIINGVGEDIETDVVSADKGSNTLSDLLIGQCEKVKEAVCGFVNKDDSSCA